MSSRGLLLLLLGKLRAVPHLLRPALRICYSRLRVRGLPHVANSAEALRQDAERFLAQIRALGCL